MEVQQKIERQFGEVRATETEDRKLMFIFSTGARDRHGTIINPDGWRLENFNKNGIASWQHRAYGDPDPDNIIGPAKAWVKDGKLVGTVDFEPADINPLADTLYKKAKNGTLNAVSVGFREISGHWGDEEDKEDPNTYYFDEVELLEISLVTVPSNPEALMYRGFEAVTATEAPKYSKSDLSSEVDINNQKSNNTMEDEKRDGLKQEVEVKVNTEALDRSIEKLGETVEQLRDLNIPGPGAGDLSEKDKKDLSKYSIAKAILTFADPRRNLDGIELEMHQEAQREMKQGKMELQGLGIPSIIHSRADLKASVDASGGYTVATEMQGLIPTLRNNMASVNAGAKLLTGLQGDVTMPRRATDSAATWRSEGGVSTQSDPTYEQVTLTPKRLTTHTEFTHQLLRQSSIDVEAEVRDTLFYSIANALETAVYSGSGSSNQPTGILNASGVNDGDHGSNGTILSWANVVQLESMVATDNGMAAKMAYITNATAAGKMKTTLKSTYQGGYIWEMFTPLTKGMINGYDAYITNTISNGITRGTNNNCSALIFGDWSQLLIGQFGAVDLIVNPYSLDTYGTVRVVVAGYYDVAVKQPKAFAAIAGLEN
jgi:HK97 family phage major capsid protein/HK97 family phage prohead protease